MFSSTHLVVINTIVDLQTPYSYIIANLITETICLKRHVHVGIIYKYNANKSYFITNMTNVLLAVIVRAMLGLSHFPTADTSCYVAITQLILPSFSNSLVPVVSGEVTLTQSFAKLHLAVYSTTSKHRHLPLLKLSHVPLSLILFIT
jgi:hypothetical protein